MPDREERKVLGIRIDPRTFERLRQKADQKGTTVSALIRTGMLKVFDSVLDHDDDDAEISVEVGNPGDLRRAMRDGEAEIARFREEIRNAQRERDAALDGAEKVMQRFNRIAEMVADFIGERITCPKCGGMFENDRLTLRAGSWLEPGGVDCPGCKEQMFTAEEAKAKGIGTPAAARRERDRSEDD